MVERRRKGRARTVRVATMHMTMEEEEQKEEDTLVGAVTKKVAEVEVRVLGKREEESTRMKAEEEEWARRIGSTS